MLKDITPLASLLSYIQHHKTAHALLKCAVLAEFCFQRHIVSEEGSNSCECKHFTKNCVCLQENDEKLYFPALENLRSQIRASTTSMTSVPKPLKFMRPHYDTMKQIYTKIQDPQTKEFCADVVSVLAMTMSDNRDCLKYRLLGSQCQIGDWGHEYVR
jgi:hypothetical protein